MPNKRGGRTPSRPSNNRAAGTVMAFILGAAFALGAAYLYRHSSSRAAPTAAAPPPPAAPEPRPTVRTATPPLRVAPFGTSEDVFEAGAHLYAARCASCHGTPRKDVASTPAAPQLWRSARHTSAAQTTSALYNEISAGAPARGMPSYEHTLTDTQTWQLALLLKNTDQELPDPVVGLLNGSPRH